MVASLFLFIFRQMCLLHSCAGWFCNPPRSVLVCVAVFFFFFSFCIIARCAVSIIYEVVWCAGWWCRFRLRCSPPRSLFELCTRGVFLTYASTHTSATEFKEIGNSEFCLVLFEQNCTNQGGVNVFGWYFQVDLTFWICQRSLLLLFAVFWMIATVNSSRHSKFTEMFVVGLGLLMLMAQFLDLSATITYMQKAGDTWDISPPFFFDFPQNFRLRTRNQYCTQAIAWGSTI